MSPGEFSIVDFEAEKSNVILWLDLGMEEIDIWRQL